MSLMSMEHQMKEEVRVGWFDWLLDLVKPAAERDPQVIVED